MDIDLFQKIVDECAALGITHVRVHNYGEPFLDEQLVEKVRYAKQQGHRRSRDDQQRLADHRGDRARHDRRRARRDQHQRRRGRQGSRSSARALQPRTTTRSSATSGRWRGCATRSGRTHPKLILSFVRQNNSADEQAFIDEWSQIADKIHITDLHNWAGTLNAKSDVQYPVLPPVADVHGAVGRPGVALLRGLRRPPHPRRPAHVDDRARSGTRPPTGPSAGSTSKAAGPEICRSCDLPKKDSPLWVKKLV